MPDSRYLSDIQFVDNLYKDYLNNPLSVDESWRNFFKGFEFAISDNGVAERYVMSKEFKVLNLINGYRQRGHLFTKTNPVRIRREYKPGLDITNFDLSDNELNKEYHAGEEIGLGKATLNQIIARLQQTYCSSVGAEFMYIRNPEKLKWLLSKMESSRNSIIFNKLQKADIYKILVKTVGFEQFLHKKFTGQKRFSLEGAESLIPALGYIIEKGALSGIREYVIGNSHRGRLNVLANIFKKPFRNIFSEYTGKSYVEDNVLGDVKYHLGYDSVVATREGIPVSLIMLPNPSHLETVGPATQGFTRARLENIYGNDKGKICPVLIHGDAAVAAQGIVYETIQMSGLEGYGTGGTIHLVINNQVGFTTNYLDARSGTYCTDVAKVTLSPVFHVNGDDVEALLYTAELALEYRNKFGTDVFIDILCYRKYGHNEGDEPRFTQPVLYKAIASHPNVRDIYAKHLIETNQMTQLEIYSVQDKFNKKLESEYSEAGKIDKVGISPFLKDKWQKYRFFNVSDFESRAHTSVTKDVLLKLSAKINYLPPNKKFFSKIEKIVENRAALIKENKADWAMAELLAYASLVYEQHPVRICGQDTERGTFSHRHSTFHVDDTGEKYCPLKHVSENQAVFQIYNSLLSEYAALAYEYGYALALPGGLTIWEAQFGDFHNVAQAVIDQYISSAGEKWGLMNNIVLFLPHGFEGQGPEHSSARIERFLSLCANNNMFIVNCSTPANLFHVLRRQVYADYRIPLVIFTPKSLLRHPKCISQLDEFAGGYFIEIIDDTEVDKPNARQVVLCSGKIYYELINERQKLNDYETAIVRIEQYYPFPEAMLNEILKSYPGSTRTVWVQEEPANMGALPFISLNINIPGLFVVCRSPSASPAPGLLEIHNLQQQKLLDKTFKRCDCERLNIYCMMKCIENQ